MHASCRVVDQAARARECNDDTVCVFIYEHADEIRKGQ